MKTLMDILMKVPLKEQWRRIKTGLKCPKDSPEHRYAKEALLCMFGPTTISMVGSVAVACGALFIEIESKGKDIDVAYQVEVVDPKTTKLDELKVDEEKVEEFKPPEPVEDLDPTKTAGVASEITTPGPPQEFSSNDDPAGVGNGVGGDMDTPVVPFAVVMTKSPIIIKGLYGNRTKGGRQLALKMYGGGGGGGGLTEGAVLRALRWLKKNQNSDGSWEKTKPAMTGLALLTYLAHGDTPSSPEFGATVEKAIKWLIDNQEADGRFKGRDGHDYSHPIATYALCEAFGMTKHPLVKTGAEKALDIVIKGQHASGGWDYNCGPGTRDDTSYMGWCAQALKAGKMAGLENAGLSEAMKKSVLGFKKNTAPDGKVGYVGAGDGSGGLTGVGVLCMQLMGASREMECRNGVVWLEKNASFDWDKPWLGASIYYWYYTTQTKFHCGGDIWKRWNAQFATQLIKNQQIIKEGIDGPKGKKFDIGWWEGPRANNAHSDGLVMDTCLCTLQLEVYYRYLPTYQPPAQEGEATKTDANDIEIKVTAPAK